MEFSKMVTITLYARQQKRHRCIEQSFGLCGRGRGWDDLGEWHWIMYNIIYETNHHHRYTCVPHPEHPSYLPLHPILQGHPSAPALSTLSPASNLDWWSVSHMIIYMFQCYSLKSSHPCLLPQSPKDCSIHLCLFCCLAYRVIVTIFLNSMYMHYYTVLVFFFLTYFTLYNRLQFHPPH